jgi:hypothetical protein
VNTVYVLGAGASAAAARGNKRVLGGTFLRCAFKRGKGDPRLESVEEFVREFFHYDAAGHSVLPALEEVLSAVDIALDRGDSLSAKYTVDKLQELRRNFAFLIYQVLVDAYGELGNDVTNCFVRKLNIHPTVLSFNYDIIIDNALKQQFGHNLDYGIEYRAYDLENGSLDFVKPNKVRLYKIHGSLNWAMCPTCGVVYIADPQLGKIAGLTFDLDAKCMEPGHAPLEVLLVTPTNLKSYAGADLSMIWQRAERALRGADQVVFIGYSLPHSDFHIKYLLQKTLYRHPEPEIVVVDLKSADARRPTEEEKRYKRLFGTQITYYTKGFDRYVAEEMQQQ